MRFLILICFLLLGHQLIPFHDFTLIAQCVFLMVTKQCPVATFGFCRLVINASYNNHVLEL